jgi:hypothetical protein
MSKGSLMDMESTYGPMETYTRDNSLMELAKAKVFSVLQMDKSMMENSKTI